jgi:N-acetylglucosamine kinase-like BadF-type ATPase
MRCVLAVDGGNTKTIALVAALDGTILGAGRGGCADIYHATPDLPAPLQGGSRDGVSRDGMGSDGTPHNGREADGAVYDGTEIEGTAADGAGNSTVAAALGNVAGAVGRALAAAGVGPRDLVAGVFNMAGADWPEDIALWREAMRARGFGQSVLAQNDALGVLYAGSPDATGVSVVCGTGAATGARAPNGRVWHSSFWQDEAQGSAHLGRKTLFAVYRAALGIAPPTSLTARVLRFYGADTAEQVLHRFTNLRHPAPTHADHLTPILLDEAHAGDPVAREVVVRHGAALGQIALAAARQVGIEGTAFALVLAGGVFRHPTTVLEDAIVAAVRTASPAVRPLRSPHEPIIGVLYQAFAAAGVPVDDALRARLVATMPGAALFATAGG